MKKDLLTLIAQSKARVASMTPVELEEMHRQQRESYVRSIVDWPKPKFEWVDGVKVYASYADYCND